MAGPICSSGIGTAESKWANQAVNRSGEVGRFQNEQSFVAARLRRSFANNKTFNANTMEN
jgi:hypothetical protein